MADYRTLENKWLAENPLKTWRSDKSLFLKDLGAALGVGYHTIFRWENGMSSPNLSQFKLLKKLMRNKNIEQQFQEWKDKRPLLGKGGK